MSSHNDTPIELTRRVVQIAICDAETVALCNDGTVWGISSGNKWFQYAPIPQPETEKTKEQP